MTRTTSRLLALILLHAFNLFFLDAAYAIAVRTIDGKVISDGGIATVYYADPSKVATSATLAIDPTATTKDFGSNPEIIFEVTGISGGKPYLVVVVKTNSSQLVVPLNSCFDGATCTSGDPRATLTASDSTVRIGLRLNTICSQVSGIDGCSGATLDLSTTSAPNGMLFSFVNTDQVWTVNTSVSTTDFDGGGKFAVIPETAGPAVSGCPTFPTGYSPSDEAINFNTDLVAVTRNSTTQSSPSFDTFVVVANEGIGQSIAVPFAADVVSRNIRTGVRKFEGFKNSDETTQHWYTGNIGVQDSAGVTAFCGPPNYADGSSVTSALFATKINGFLKEGNCFVAQATFQNEKSWQVAVLRRFRDQILSKSAFGKHLIHFYYRKSPALANWLIESSNRSSWARAFSKMILTRVSLQIGLVFWIQDLFADEPSYSAEIKKKLEADDTLDYTKKIKQSLPPEPDADSSEDYTRKVREKIGLDSLSSDGYTNSLRNSLEKPDSESAIADFKSNKKLKPNYGNDPKRDGFSLKFLASTSRVYQANTREAVPYEKMYGNAIVPEIGMVYERKIRGPLLAYAGVSVSFVKGSGQLQYTQGGTYNADSGTKFTFVTVPAETGILFRPNVGGVFWPFIGGGPGVMGVMERRSDGKESPKGYLFTYHGQVGLNLGLDWLNRDSQWDRYESTNVRDTFLTIGYHYTSSLPGGLMDLTVQGVLLGFTFGL